MSQSASREGDAFRQLVEGRISVEEYLEDLERRVTEIAGVVAILESTRSSVLEDRQ